MASLPRLIDALHPRFSEPRARQNWLTATIAGLTFAVILVGVQLGIYFGVRKIISDVIDHTHAALWIVPFHARSFEEAYGVLGDDERHQALATPGVKSVTPLVVFFGTWNRPDRGITHVLWSGPMPKMVALRLGSSAAVIGPISSPSTKSPSIAAI